MGMDVVTMFLSMALKLGQVGPNDTMFLSTVFKTQSGGSQPKDI